MKYYLKKCGRQELGSVRDGRAQRGRYIYISKDDEALSLFPILSTTHLNDKALLAILPLYSGQKVYCYFDYHNDLFHDSTALHKRDEYRMYLNKSLENNQLLFQENDIIVMRPERISNDNLADDDKTQIVYYLDLVQERESEYYKWLDSEITNHRIKGGHGLYEGEIAEFETKVVKFHCENEVKVSVDKSVTGLIKKTTLLNTLANLFNAVSFRDFVMVGYENVCAVTRTVIRYENYMNLEAAHIRPKSRGGLYLPSNGIAMCRDMHWAFDKGFFTLTDDCTVSVHPETTSEWLLSYNGKKIKIPNEPFFRPSVDGIQYHRQNIYGLFKTTGRL